MKKLLFILLVIAALVSCEDKDSFDLEGKRYVYSPMTVKSDGQYLYYVYYFVSDTEVEDQVRKGSATGSLFVDIDTHTYTLDYPHLTITESDGSEFTYTFVTETTFRNDFNSSSEFNLD